MKKIVLVLSILVIVSPLFSQNANSQITDYFPLGIGNTWTYANKFGEIAEAIIMRNSTPDNVSNDGTFLYLVEWQYVGTGSGSTLYSIKQNKVLIMVEKNMFGQYRQNNPPSPILAPAGQEWRYNDRGDDLRYKTSKSSCVFDGKTFNDCILVEEQIVDGRNVLRTKKSYYAKDIGLVYVALQSPGESESVYRKLASCNFIDIGNMGASDDLQPMSDALIKTDDFYAIHDYLIRNGYSYNQPTVHYRNKENLTYGYTKKYEDYEGKDSDISFRQSHVSYVWIITTDKNSQKILNRQLNVQIDNDEIEDLHGPISLSTLFSLFTFYDRILRSKSNVIFEVIPGIDRPNLPVFYSGRKYSGTYLYEKYGIKSVIIKPTDTSTDVTLFFTFEY